MDSSTVIINGSHRRKGHTSVIVSALALHTKADVVDLIDHSLGHYTYDHRHREDDFLPLMKRISTYDHIIWATPVYWYAMSGRLKVFMDRITDCLQIDKPLGRSLAGKSCAALCCSSDHTDYQGFFMPFQLTANYLDMKYVGDLHTWLTTDGHIPQQVVDRWGDLLPY